MGTTKPPAFKSKHTVKYGLKVSARAPGSSKVTSVICRFCSRFGREDKPNAQHKASSRHKVYQKFLPYLYESDNKGQHPIKWAEYTVVYPMMKIMRLL
ncbi:hypothetical protein PPTG_22567 [Phytophthora nicotianae INRA-310]|uniref:Uncharacterized protein n=1 Tax=Phytophthora nicotianae (strain INRA-310) TaxID=761204 RepID=W2QDI0_PHYN3|nr:hypothetical protein PPTG_22567 [Phytophthora nicotianae INRA-310]ETN11248.1 hypothetical protein PPTG_22567 [Phytophthora nicotianae INRA-310]